MLEKNNRLMTKREYRLRIVANCFKIYRSFSTARIEVVEDLYKLCLFVIASERLNYPWNRVNA